MPEGEVTSFPKAVQKQDNEKIVFSWIVWESKEVRDKNWQAMEQDPVMSNTPMPFDGKRLIYGGFSTILDY